LDKVINRLPGLKVNYDKILKNNLHQYIQQNSVELLHITYMEDMAQLAYDGYKRLITFHQPIAQQKLFSYYTKNIHSTDSIVVVSTEPISYLQQFTNDITYIPHGVETNYFTPDASVEKSKIFQCITCGAHLRDYETLRKIVQLSHQRNLPIQFVIVYPERALAFNPHLYNLFTDLQRYKTVNLKISISDTELLQLYRTSHVGLMPLFDSTANNALLEMAACGLPIINTNLIGTRDYLDESFTQFVEHNNVNTIVNLLEEQLNSILKFSNPSELATNHMKTNFDFKVIAEQFDNFYTQKLNG
jgi:glycosyltransferase involved in cell wall biosynthesis